MLAAQGYKRCASHQKYLDRLAPQYHTTSHESGDCAVRPLHEFGKSSFTKDGKQPNCLACDHIWAKDQRERAKQTAGTVPTAIEKQKAQLARLIAQRNALTARIDALQAALNTQQA